MLNISAGMPDFRLRYRSRFHQHYLAATQASIAAVRKDAFHEPYLAYALRARSYLAYGSYPHGATHLCTT